MANVTRFKELNDDFLDFMRDEEGLEVADEPKDNEDFLKGSLKFIADQLHAMKDEKEDQIIEIPGYIEFVVSYREGEGKNPGTYNISAVFGEEIKKRIKDDENA